MEIMNSSRLVRILLRVAGTLSVGLAILGIFLPLLPTTPFLLLAAVCYAKSSTKLYNRLLNNKYLGSYIRNYREGKGISLKVKIMSISLLILTIGYTSIFVIHIWLVRVILFFILIGVSIHILSFPTLRIKVSQGKLVKTGEILVRGVATYKAGVNVKGLGTLYALCEGKIYFTKKKTSHGKVRTFINVLATPR